MTFPKPRTPEAVTDLLYELRKGMTDEFGNLSKKGYDVAITAFSLAGRIHGWPAVEEGIKLYKIKIETEDKK